jgi:hypothetical protein
MIMPANIHHPRQLEKAMQQRMHNGEEGRRPPVRLQEGCILAQPRTEQEAAEGYVNVRVRTDLDLYIRYQTANDRAYARAAAELAKRRKGRQLAERRGHLSEAYGRLN